MNLRYIGGWGRSKIIESLRGACIGFSGTLVAMPTIIPSLLYITLHICYLHHALLFTPPRKDLQFAFPNGLTVRESDTGDEEAILWVADSRNACIRQLLIDDEPYEDPIEKSKDDNDADGRPQSQPSMHSAGTESHHLSASHRPLTSPAFLETGGPSPVAVPPFTVGEPRSGVPMKTKVIACESLIGGAEPPDPDRDPEEGDHPDPMRRGNINGSFEDATLEQPVMVPFIIHCSFSWAHALVYSKCI